MSYTKNEPQCKVHETYKLLQANSAQQTLRDIDDDFKSFFGLLKSPKVKKARLPKYREKGGLYTLTISGNSINVMDGYLILLSNRTYSKILNNYKIKIRFPEKLVGKKINEVKFIPQYNGRYFKIAYCYKVDEENLNLNRENSLAIDMGLDNLATRVTNAGTSFIMDGRKIKQINQHWNKIKACLQAILTRQKQQQHFFRVVETNHDKEK